jgi:hypothetical protein
VTSTTSVLTGRHGEVIAGRGRRVVALTAGNATVGINATLATS